MRRTQSHWQALSLPPRPLPSHVDVVIIGAGIAGCSAALELHRAGISFALLEQHSAIGTGISSRDIAHAKLGLGDNPARLYNGLGKEITQDILQYTYENSLWLIEQSLDLQRGGLYVAKNQAEALELQQSVDILQKLQWPVQAWSSKKIQRTLQANQLCDGYYHPNDVSYSPTQFFQHCRNIAEHIITNCQVLSIHSLSTLEVETSRGRLACEIVIIANNSHAPSVDDFFIDKITPVRQQTLAIPINTQQLPVHCQFGYIQWRDINNIRLVSGCRWGTPHLETGEDNDAIVSPQIGHHLRNFIDKTFGFSDDPLLEWTGIMGFSCDGLPLVGPLPGASDILACCGFSGHQSALGFRAGQSMARLILDGHDPSLPNCFLPSRFL